MPHSISAIITEIRNISHFRLSIESLINQLSQYESEIIVVTSDDSPTIQEVIHGYDQNGVPLIHLHIEGRHSTPTALNRGIEKATGDNLLLLRSGTVLLPESVELMLEYLSTGRNVGLLTPLVRSSDMKTLNTIGRFPLHRDVLLNTLGLRRGLSAGSTMQGDSSIARDLNSIRDVEQSRWFAWFTRREVITKVGMFDENFPRYYHDTDWCKRLRKEGFSLIHYPQTSVMVYNEKSPRHVLQQQVSLFRLLDKHYDRVYHQVANLLVGLVIYSSIPFWYVRSLLIKEQT